MCRYPGFRARRQRVFIDFPRDNTVDVYLKHVVNPFLRDMLGAVPRPPTHKASAAAPSPPRSSTIGPSSNLEGTIVNLKASAAAGVSPSAQPVVSVTAPPPMLPRGDSPRAAEKKGWLSWLWRSRSPANTKNAAPQATSPPSAGPESPSQGAGVVQPASTMDGKAVPVVSAAVPMTPLAPDSVAAEPVSLLRQAEITDPHTLPKDDASLRVADVGLTSSSLQPPVPPPLAAVPALLKEPLLPQPLPPATDPPAKDELTSLGAATAMPVAAARAAARALKLQQQGDAISAADPLSPTATGAGDMYAADSPVPEPDVTARAAVPPSSSTLPSPSTVTAASPVNLVETPSPLGGLLRGASLQSTQSHVFSVDTAAIVGNGPAGELTDDIYLLAPEEIATIVGTVGGHLQDLLTVVTAVTRGQAWGEALERLVADSAEAVEHLLAGVRDAPGGGGAASAGTAAVQGGRRLVLRGSVGPAYALPAHDYQAHPSPARLAAYGRYARAWALLCALGERRYVSRRELATLVFPACPQELDVFISAGLVTCINAKSKARVDSPSRFLQLQADHPGEYITAASPRLRVAFRVVTRDARLRIQTSRILAALRVASLRAEEAELMQRLPEVIAERAYALQMLATLLARDTALRSTVVKEMLTTASLSAPPADKQTATLLRLGEGETPLGMTGLAAAMAVSHDRVSSLDREADRLREALRKTRDALAAALTDATAPSHAEVVDACSAASSAAEWQKSPRVAEVETAAPNWGVAAPATAAPTWPYADDRLRAAEAGGLGDAQVSATLPQPSEAPAAAWSWLLGPTDARAGTSAPPSSFAYPAPLSGERVAAMAPRPGARVGGASDSDDLPLKNVGAPPLGLSRSEGETQAPRGTPFRIGRGGAAWEGTGSSRGEVGAAGAEGAEPRWTQPPPPPQPVSPSYYSAPPPAAPPPLAPAPSAAADPAAGSAAPRRRWRYRRSLNVDGSDAAGGGAPGAPHAGDGSGAGAGGGSPGSVEGREWHGSDSAGGYRWWL